MRLYSTKKSAPVVSLQEAVTRGLAPDQGLYMPEYIPVLPESFFQAAPQMSFQEIACTVADNLLGDEIPKQDLNRIVCDTIQFDAPLVELENGIYALELFHGPTLAFKDFGARFLSRLLGYYAGKRSQDVTVLVATSGDTGSAVAHGFYNTPGTKVIILYPDGKVSELQEKQFTTLGGNITALKISGTFDDCQRLVKQAFSDQDLNDVMSLASANSINIARLVPQSFYYFYAWSRLPERRGVVFSVPSGNFGNLTAGLIAKKMGLNIDAFIAATNANDVVPEYLEKGIYHPRPSVSTISNAMDVGNPSNFDRILELFGQDWKLISQMITGYRFSDKETIAAMKFVFDRSGYQMDPHGSVGYLGLKRYKETHADMRSGVFLETAHPAKFIESVESAIQSTVKLPQALEDLKNKTVLSEAFPNDFSALKGWLLNRAGQ
jgi:threonine synthase